jgi:hypothetical protein
MCFGGATHVSVSHNCVEPFHTEIIRISAGPDAICVCSTENCAAGLLLTAHSSVVEALMQLSFFFHAYEILMVNEFDGYDELQFNPTHSSLGKKSAMISGKTWLVNVVRRRTNLSCISLYVTHLRVSHICVFSRVLAGHGYLCGSEHGCEGYDHSWGGMCNILGGGLL